MTARRLHSDERVADHRARGWWSTETMDGLLRARVAERADAIALVDPLNLAALTGAEPRRLTWTEVDRDTDRLAAVLIGLGLEPGDVVGVLLPNSVDLVLLYLAAWRIGLIVSPMPVQYREHEVGQVAELAEMRCLVTVDRIGDRRLATEAMSVRAGASTLVDVLAHGANPPAGATGLDALLAGIDDAAAHAVVEDHIARHPADPNDCVTICWTSGTEGLPKGVLRAHCDWLAMSWATVEAPGMNADEVLLNPFPMVNMAGINGMLLPWLRTGCTLVQHQPFDLDVFLSQIEGERVTYTVAQPALLTLLLQRDDLLAGRDISSLRQIGSGSTPLLPAMVAGWQDRGIGVINYFGSNEGIALVGAPADIPDPVERAQFFPRYGAANRRWTSRVADQTTVRLVDLGTGAEITEPGRPGELRLWGPSVFAGYLHAERLGSPFDDRGWLRTGDVFVIAGANGEFLQYVDRAKDLVIRGGMNIAPAELEGLIAGHPDVAEVAIIGVPDDVLGERVCAVVVPRAGRTVTLEGIIEHLRGLHIASYKLPERLEVRSALPRSPIGKVLKRDLRSELVPVAR